MTLYIQFFVCGEVRLPVLKSWRGIIDRLVSDCLAGYRERMVP